MIGTILSIARDKEPSLHVRTTCVATAPYSTTTRPESRPIIEVPVAQVDKQDADYPGNCWVSFPRGRTANEGFDQWVLSQWLFMHEAYDTYNIVTEVRGYHHRSDWFIGSRMSALCE
jgi:hypothetical protein